MGNPCTNCIDATTFNKGNECFTIGTDNIIYTGPPLPCSNIQTQDNFTEALQKLDAIICTLGAPQNLQSVLVTGNIATDIGAKFISTVTPLIYTEILNDQVTSGAFIKIDGLATEYLMADGSVTTNTNIIADIIAQSIVDGDITHAPSGNAVFDSLTSVYSAIALKADDALVIHNFGNETKTGTLTVNAIIKSGGLITEYLMADGSTTTLNNIISGIIVQTITDGDTTHASSSDALFDALALKANDNAVIHDTGNETKTGDLTVNAIIKSGGTALQYLMADGSVTLLSNIVSGLVTQTITNGDTTHAPSGDAVYDALLASSNAVNAALALKQDNLILTVAGNSGPATFVSPTLNVPTYTLAGLGGQPLSADLTAIDALGGNLGFLYKTGVDTWTLDTNTYLTSIAGIVAGGELAGTYPNPTLVNDAVTGKVLTGFTVVGGGILATDTILQAFGKTQDQINALTGGVRYLGLWDASTNTPALSDGSGVQGDMYIVSVAGATSLDGITPWAVGDRVYRDATKWTRPPAAISAVGAGVPNYIARWDSVSTLTTGLIYDNGINVGIGTSTFGSERLKIVPLVNSTGLVVDLPLVDNSPTGGVPDAVSIYIRGHNGTSQNQVSGFYAQMIGNKNAGLVITNGNHLPADATNSTGIDILFRETSTTNTIIKGRRGNSTVFNVSDAGNTGIGGVSSASSKLIVNPDVDNTGVEIVMPVGSAQYPDGLLVRMNGTAYAGPNFGITSAVTVLGNSNNSAGFLMRFDTGTGNSAFRYLKRPEVNGNLAFNVTETGSSISQFNVNDLGHVFGQSYVKAGGTATQYLMADGSVSTLANPVTGTGTTNYITKWTGVNTQGNSQIFDNGTNVGIGTTTPIVKLDVDAGSAFTSAYFHSAEPSGGNHYTGIRFGTVSTPDVGKAGGIGYYEKTSDLINSGIYINNYGDSELNAGLFIKRGGNVGIGTPNPSVKLDVNGAINISMAGVLTPPAGLTYGIFGYSGVGLGFYSQAGGYSWWGGNTPIELMVINRISGNVGIGVTNPIEKIEVAGNARIGGNIILNYGNYIGTNQVNSKILETGYSDQDFVKIYVSGAGGNTAEEKITILGNTGNVGIGIADPLSRLSVYGDIMLGFPAAYQGSYGKIVSRYNGQNIYNNSAEIDFIRNENASGNGANIVFRTSSGVGLVEALKIVGNGTLITRAPLPSTSATDAINQTSIYVGEVNSINQSDTAFYPMITGYNLLTGIGYTNMPSFGYMRPTGDYSQSGEAVIQISGDGTPTQRWRFKANGNFISPNSIITGGNLVVEGSSELKGQVYVGAAGPYVGITWWQATGSDLVLGVREGTRMMELRNGNYASPTFSACTFKTGHIVLTNDLTVGGTVTASSDIRLKTNIKPLKNSLSKVLKTQGSIYDRIDTGDKNQIGFVADDLLKVFPELVNVPDDKEEYKTVNYMGMTAVLVEAIKEQAKVIKKLEKRILKLESK